MTEDNKSGAQPGSAADADAATTSPSGAGSVAGHTPGPWCICPETNGQEIVAYDAKPWHIRGEIVGVYKWPENWLANARLIAAAPDFFEAASALVEAWDARATAAQQIITGKSDRELQQQAMAAIESLRAALAKARGQ